MTLTIISHVVAFMLGGGSVFLLLHKHQLAAVNAASGLASAVDSAKTELKKL